VTGVQTCAPPIFLLWALIGTPEFTKMVAHETSGRLAGQMHRENILFYLYILPAVFFPWSPALVSALACAWRKIVHRLPLRGPDDASPSQEEVRDVADPFLAAWVVGIVIFFSIPGAKLGTYMLPALPAAAVLTARFLLRLRSAEEPVRAVWVWLPALFVVLLAAGVAYVAAHPHYLPRDPQQVVAELPLSIGLQAAILILLTCVPWLAACGLRRAAPVAVVLPLALAGLVVVGLPLVLARLEFKSTSRDLSRRPEVLAHLTSARFIYTAGWEEEGLAYYLRRNVHEVPHADPGAVEIRISRAGPGTTQGSRGGATAPASEQRADEIRDVFVFHPSGQVLLFAHKRKLMSWLGASQWPPGPELLPRARLLTENRYVAVFVSEPPPSDPR
jgi:4-amino-4-deoxy-L-arabinose transferase-like glycosyltransferase